MKKSELVALGIADDIASQVVEMVEAELKGNYIPKSRFDEVNEAKKNAEALVAERDKQIQSLKDASQDSESLQKQITDLQTANKEAQKQYEQSLHQMKIDNAVEKAITEKNGKNVTAIRALLNLTDAKFAEDGTVIGLAEQLDGLIKAESSSFMFGNGAPKGFVPAENEGGAGGGVDFSKMNYDQLCQYLADNPDAKLQ